jgi:hypothetical protein
MIKPAVVPERWMSRAGKESPQGSFTLSEEDLKDATFARLVLSTWSGDVDDTSVHELRLNGQRLASRFGEFHNYDLDALEVPLDRLKVGRNEITTFSTFLGHMLEIWRPHCSLSTRNEPPTFPILRRVSRVGGVRRAGAGRFHLRDRIRGPSAVQG